MATPALILRRSLEGLLRNRGVSRGGEGVPITAPGMATPIIPTPATGVPSAPGGGPNLPAAPVVPPPAANVSAVNSPAAAPSGQQLGEVLIPEGVPQVNGFQAHEPPTTTEAFANAQPPASEEEAKSRLLGWRAFVERFKEDPDLRMALLQTTLGMTQPAGNPAEAVGRAIQGGLSTFNALKTQKFEQGQQQQETGIRQQEADARTADVGNRREEWEARVAQQREELDVRREQVRNDAEYQRQLIELRRQENASGGSEGQVNQRWTRVRDALLVDPNPELAAIEDPEARRARAELIAFDLINKSGQRREQFIADFLADQRLFLPDPAEDPEEYEAAMQQLILQAQGMADSAGLSGARATPETPPGGGTVTPGPTAQQLTEGAPVSVSAGNGQRVQGTVVSVGQDTVVIDFPEPYGRQTIPRSSLGGM